MEGPGTDGQVEVSVILPVRNEEKNIEKVVEELYGVLKRLGLSHEVIAVHIPGRDRSWDVLLDLAKRYDHFYPVNMRYLRFKGLQKGYQYMLGFSLAKGTRIVQMDSDYQDDPGDLPKFLKKLDEGYDLVVGWKQDRKDPFFYTLTSKIQNAITRVMSGITIHDKNCGFKAYTRAAMQAVNLHGMNYRDIPLQLVSKGFRVAEVPIVNRVRIGGTSNFNFMNRLIGGTVDFLAAVFMSLMGDAPFRLWGGLGISLGVAGAGGFVIFALWVLVLSNRVGLNWWVFLWVALSLLSTLAGLVLFSIGVLAEYMRSLREYRLDDYAILDDPGGIVKERGYSG